MGGLSGSGQFTEIGGGSGEVLGGIIGEIIAIGNWAEFDRLRKKAEQMYGDVSLPTMEKVAVQEQGQTELSGVRQNAGYKNSEDEALRMLMEEAKSGGMTARDQQKLEQAKQEAASYERGATGAFEARQRARGQYGGGAETAAQIAAQQGGVSRAYQGGIDTAAASSDRALQSLIAGGQYARGLSQDDLAQQNKRAEAQDRINSFNLGRKDRAAYYNSDLEQRQFEDEMRKAGAMSNLANQQAEDQKMKANMATSKGRGYGRTAGATAGAAGDMGADVWGSMLDYYMGGGGMG